MLQRAGVFQIPSTRIVAGQNSTLLSFIGCLIVDALTVRLIQLGDVIRRQLRFRKADLKQSNGKNAVEAFSKKART